MANDSYFVGVDVAKDTLDVAFVRGEEETTSQLSNTPAGWAALVATCKERSVERIVLEATGRYERRVVAELMAAGLPIVVINPRQTRDFANTINTYWRWGKRRRLRWSPACVSCSAFSMPCSVTKNLGTPPFALDNQDSRLPPAPLPFAGEGSCEAAS
jgi:hypothetical protein